MTETPNKHKRIIGLDMHPDTFTAAVLIGDDPTTATIENIYDAIPTPSLEKWAKKVTQKILV